MPQKIQFDLKRAEKGDSSEIKAYLNDAKKAVDNLHVGQEASVDLLSVIDAQSMDDSHRAQVERAFNVELGLDPKTGVKFNKLNKDFDIDTNDLTATIGTDIAATMEALIRDTGLLSRVSITEQPSQSESLQLWDFDAEKNGENLAETATGTNADDVIRTGDVLIPKRKLQASTELGEFAVATMSPAQQGTYLARLLRRTRYLLIDSMLQAGAGVANGTARTAGLIRGINNNYGVNGTGDASNFIGAISYANKAAADALLPATSADAYDLAVKVKRILLPANLTEVEESDYVYVMNRATWGAISTVIDGNGRYKSDNADAVVGSGGQKTLDGAPVYIFPGVPTNKVFLFPAKLYELATYGGFQLLSDGGVVKLREGLTAYVSRIWADGSMRYGHRYLPGTEATIGTTAVDNQNQNAFRYFQIT